MSDSEKKPNQFFPVIPVKNSVFFPGELVPIFVGRSKSIAALKCAIGHGDFVFLVLQKENSDLPDIEDLYKFGVVAKIIKDVTTNVEKSEKIAKVNIECLSRARVIQYKNETKYISVELEFITDVETIDEDVEDGDLISLIELSLKKFKQYSDMVKGDAYVPYISVTKEEYKNPHSIVNMIVSSIVTRAENKQKILEIIPLYDRLVELNRLLISEMKIIEIDNKIKDSVKKQTEAAHKVFYLTEQMKAINKELDGGNGDPIGYKKLEERLKKLNILKSSKEKLEYEMKRLSMMTPMSAELVITKGYLEYILDLPWNKISKKNRSLKDAEKILNSSHYGMDEVKERILEYIAVSQRTDDNKKPILCLVGSPGVGKTSFVESIAKAINRPFERIFLAGVGDEAEIKGHRKTYLGSMPGRIISSIKNAKVSNPVILLDEIDKLSRSYKGDPAFALLEVLDSEHNHNFTDHYIDIPFDISKVVFVATANSLENIPLPLIDRLEIIRLEGYSEVEKLNIVSNYLLKKVYTETGLKKNEISISDDVIRDIIQLYTRESGVRNLKKQLLKITRKALTKIMKHGLKRIDVTKENLNEFLVRPIIPTFKETDYVVGVSTGLAYSSCGGDILHIEAVRMNGTGKIKCTGKLGDVMKESIEAAYSYIGSRCLEFGVSIDIYKNSDIHLHVPDGATPKDGPSAGIAICTAIVSCLTNNPVDPNVAMTGEISLRGKVFAIGGLKEKLLAALRVGIKKVLIPKENENDLFELSIEAKESLKCLEIIPVQYIDEVLKIALKNNLVSMDIMKDTVEEV